MSRWLPLQGSPTSPGWVTVTGRERCEGTQEEEWRCGHDAAAFAPPRPEGGWSWKSKPGEGAGSGAQDAPRAAAPAFPPPLPPVSLRGVLASPPWAVEAAALLLTRFLTGPWLGRPCSCPPALGQARPGPSTPQKHLSRIVCQLFPGSKSWGGRQGRGRGQGLVGTTKPQGRLTAQVTLAESLNAFEPHLLTGNLKSLHASPDSCWEDIIHRKEASEL